jgi:hypothetical protein
MSQYSSVTTKTLCKVHSSPPLYQYTIVAADQDDPTCSVCCSESYRATRASEEITKAHVVGKICARWNQCRHCCVIKDWLQIIKHFGGVCNPKKCSVCRWPYYEQDRREKHLPGIREALYVMILKGPGYLKGYV